VTPAPTPLPRKDPIEVMAPALLKVATVSRSPPGNRKIHNTQYFLAPTGDMDSQVTSDPLWVPSMIHDMLHTLVLPSPGTMVSVFSGSITRDTNEGKARQEVVSCLRLLDRRPTHSLCRPNNQSSSEWIRRPNPAGAILRAICTLLLSFQMW